MSNKAIPPIGLAMLLLGACGDHPRPAVSPAPAGGIPIHAAFVPQHDDQVIEVSAEDRLAITGATLILPNGSKVAAESIDSVANPSESTDLTAHPEYAAVTAGFDQPFSGSMTQTTTLIGQIASTAHIRIVEPADYAAAWKTARIEVRFGRGEAIYTQTIPAPPPR